MSVTHGVDVLDVMERYTAATVTCIILEAHTLRFIRHCALEGPAVHYTDVCVRGTCTHVLDKQLWKMFDGLVSWLV
jgi:hypothetical protein